jgi:hypothetical protein
LLVKLADNKEAARYVAEAVANNFDKLPENVQNLLFKLADNKGAAEGISYGVADNFDKLPENVQNLLFKLADNEDVRNQLEKILAKHEFSKG